jgi:nitrate reductase gamma subunit
LTKRMRSDLNRKVCLLILAAVALLCRVEDATGRWLIDPEGFHVSAHGQISCLECHGDIREKKLHPNPGNVDKSLEDFFRVEQCEDCHTDVLDEIDEGTHGGVTGKSREELTYCIGCHEPHYQIPTADREGKGDLSRPAEEKCSACHEYREVLPSFSAEDEGCMVCHQRPAADDPEAVQRISRFCFHCHGTNNGEEQSTAAASGIALIDVLAYASSPHSKVSCLVCHPDSAQYGHADQGQGDCLACHVRHDEKVAHDAHMNVSCQACHLGGVIPLKNAASGQVLWEVDRKPGGLSRIHQMLRGSEEDACRRCHVGGNSLGAAAMVLPAKSVICMPCHPATLSVGDTTTIVALLLFLIGFVGVASIWFSGGLDAGIERRDENKVLGVTKSILGALFSLRFFSIIKALIMDGLLQRRLFRQTKARWAIHALIFLPFVFRFGWGVVGLGASLCRPEWPGTWILLDKNHPATAFLFDLTGVMVMLGIVCAVVRRARRPSEEILAGLPRPDWIAYGLLGGIVLVGFLLEGMRIAMTGSPTGAEFAFVGYGLSRLFTGIDLTGLYGYVWYGHAILTGVFVAYLPFSRMIHMITVPLALALDAGSEHGGSARTASRQDKE